MGLRMKKVHYAVITLFIGMIMYVGKLLVDAGFFVEVVQQVDSGCEKRFLVPGAEDLAVVPGAGVFVSSNDRYGNKNGSIYWYETDLGLVKLNIDKDIEFHPHGIDVHVASGKINLYVINHRSEYDSLEVFSFEPDQRLLTQVKTLTDPLFVNANDIAVVSDDMWFVTHDHLGESDTVKKLEDYMRLPLSYISYFNNGKVKKIESGLRYANGVFYDDSRELLYVTSMLDRELRTYHYSSDEKSLELLSSVDEMGGVDNIIRISEDELLVASHPNLLALAAYQVDSRDKSPSKILKVTLDKNGIPEKVSTVLEDQGKNIAAASVAAVFEHNLIVGSVFDKGVLICPIAIDERISDA